MGLGLPGPYGLRATAKPAQKPLIPNQRDKLNVISTAIVCRSLVNSWSSKQTREPPGQALA